MWAIILLLLAPPHAREFQASVQAGMESLERGDLPSARLNLEQASRLDPSSAPAWFLLAQVHARLADKAAAVAAARKADQWAGTDASILYNLAIFYRNQGEFDLSIAAARRALGVEDSFEVRTALGQAYAAKQDWAKAIGELGEASRLAPFSEEGYFNLAQAHLQSRDFAGAIRVVEGSRRVFDKSPQLELALGVAYYGQRRFPDAVGRCRRVIDLDPNVMQAYYFLDRILDNADERLPEVMAKAAALVRRNPGSPLGYVLHAKALFLQLPPAGDSAEAGQAYTLVEKALALKEDFAETHHLMGLLLERRQEYAAAAKRVERCIELSGNDPQPHFVLARLYDRLGRRADAAAQRALHEKLSGEAGSPAQR